MPLRFEQIESFQTPRVAAKPQHVWFDFAAALAPNSRLGHNFNALNPPRLVAHLVRSNG